MSEQRSNPNPSATSSTGPLAERPKDASMKRILIEVGLFVAAFVLGLEATHYRNAVLECNVDRKRAWSTVVDLREKNEELVKAASNAPATGKQ
jgi:hypothetical protein